MRLHLTVSAIVILLLEPLLQILAVRNSGDCSYAKHELLKFVCKGIVPLDLQVMFRDGRAPPDTPFSVWESERNGSEDTVLLVSFYAQRLEDYDTVRLQGDHHWSGYKFLAKTNNRTDLLTFIGPCTVHCFPFSLRYPIELKRHCLGYGLSTDGNNVTNKPILHYGSLLVRSSEVSNASTFSPFRTLLLVVCAAIIWYFCTFVAD
uniref:Uncharacterized protein LOC108053478 n=1 Tax=Drosophila rhopaloa TaxID=1041015 RepID=A0A6P4G298_DRORH